jgi:hypothetical protein
MHVVDVIEAFVPRLEAPVLQCENRAAEPTPETRLSVSPDPVPLNAFFHLPVVHPVLALEMFDEELLAVKQLCAFEAVRFVNILLGAAPALQQEVLGILVPFPIVLAAKGLVAVRECTPVRAVMALDVFSEKN